MPPAKNIKIMMPEDVPGLYELTARNRHSTEEAYFDKALTEQDEDKRIVFIALTDEGRMSGYVHYNRFPKYAMFRRLGIPEIQDLYVAPDYRRNGIGTALIFRCEDQARQDRCKEIGIGVGIVPEFGNAQRLYAEHGYIPDGSGVVFEREPIQSGEIRPLDDRLCLMLVKQLS